MKISNYADALDVETILVERLTRNESENGRSFLKKTFSFHRSNLFRNFHISKYDAILILSSLHYLSLYVSLLI